MNRKKEREIIVIFEPEGRKVITVLGASIFDTASNVGVDIRSECGGKGTCGKCRVIIRERKAVTEITEVERNHLSQSEIDSGYRLACCTQLKRNITILVPQESRVGERKIQVTGLEKLVQLSPSVTKYYLDLKKPTLGDARPDYERILDFLKNEYRIKKLDIESGILKTLPSFLRQTDWKITVTIWNSQKIIAVEEGDTSNRILGLAIDIGTSKIVGCIVDLTNGKTLGVGFVENPQIIHGEDIVTRIAFATDSEKKLGILQGLAFEGINEVIHDGCAQAGVDFHNIYEVTIAGNTAMHHLFLGVQPKFLALSPFTPSISQSINLPAREVNLNIHPQANVYVLPIIAGFVGADAVANILSTGIYESKRLSLLLDIGTNTEVFVGNSEDIVSCSCASGPAFEGVHIKHGMKAVTGAIERVRINPDSDYDVEYGTIGDAEPRGICGSAMVDIIAELARCGIINRRGQYDLKVRTPRLKTVNNNVEFVIVRENESATGREIAVTQKDINEIQLAKAAIYTGCWILMRENNLKSKDLDQVLLAGAFGSYINPKSAMMIGLVPEVPIEKIKFVGNTALSGAKMTLISQEARKMAENLSHKIRYLELTSDPDFNSEFANAMFIPHKDFSRFPLAKKYFRSFEEEEKRAFDDMMDS
ncbi:MAG: ASKHA domain-containing protein [Candidatus Hermodarchaeota archaeon]